MIKHAQIEQLEQQQRMKEAEVHERLEKLQTWDAQTEMELRQKRESKAEAVRRYAEANQVLQADAQQQLPQAQAQAAAPGAPVQQQVPAQQTRKQRRAQEKKRREARKHCSVGTEETYELQERTATLLKEQEDSRAPYLKEALEKHVDNRILKVFCEGYRKGRLGRPATAEDRAKKERDQAFFEDYLSQDLQRRQPHLERFKRELLEFPVTKDTISDANFVKNAAQIKRITDRTWYFDNMMKDPINAPYFNALPQEERAVLERKLQLLGYVGGYFVNKSMAMGVSSNMGEYIKIVQPEMAGEAEAMRMRLDEDMRSMMADCRDAVEPAVERMAEQERNPFLYPVKESLRTMREQEKDGLNIEFSQPAFKEVYDQMRAIRELIASEPTVYRANRAMIDGLYQDAYRTLDLYNDMKMEEQLYLGVAGKFDAGGTLLDRAKKAAAVKKVKDCQEQFQAYTQRIDAITSALNFCLKEEALSGEARSILDELGYTRQTEGLIRLRSILKKVQPGNAANDGNADAANDGNADAAPQE